MAAAMIFLILGPKTTFAWARTASLPAIFMALTTLAPDPSLFFEAWLTTTLAPRFPSSRAIPAHMRLHYLSAFYFQSFNASVPG